MFISKSTGASERSSVMLIQKVSAISRRAVRGYDCVQSLMESGELGITTDETDVCPKHSLQIIGEQCNGRRNRAWEASLLQTWTFAINKE